MARTPKPNPTPVPTRRFFLPGVGASFVTLSLLTGLGATALTAQRPQAEAAPPKVTAKKAKGQSGAKPVAFAPLGGDETPLSDRQRIVHVFSRMGFGPRPGDVVRVQKMGMKAYMEAQLNPETIADTPVQNKVAGLTLLQLDQNALRDMYAERQVKLVGLIAKASTNKKPGEPMMDEKGEAMQGETKPGASAILSDEQSRREMYRNATPEMRAQMDTLREAQQKVRMAAIQLQTDKIVRAVESERQFQEVMVDFWSNHFNIDMRKGQCQTFKISDERDVIRKHAFGKFRDLLGASAHSPAMLVYLDNYQSQVAREPGRMEKQIIERRREQLQKQADAGDEQAKNTLTYMNLAQVGSKKGLNENYAREIMELHTLGVDGGYTQKDVGEVARCLTGWGINRQTGGFEFQARRHDDGEKQVLGRTIPAGGGKSDGDTVLDVLSSHPATMRHISEKLCRRLVSDTPPKSLVDKCVATWKQTNGDLREVYRTIVFSPEFMSRAAYRQKIKAPFEYAVSSVRAMGGRFDLTPEGVRRVRGRLFQAGKEWNQAGNTKYTLMGQIALMGQPLYQYTAPTGYSELGQSWVSSGALVARLNFALTLVGGRLADVDLPQAPGEMAPAQLVEYLGQNLLNGEMTPSTRATLLKQAEVAPSDTNVAQETTTQARLTALLLGSPEFQRR